MEVPTANALRKLKVVELRQRLSKLSLPQAGIKEELISRLINYYQEQADVEQDKGEDEMQEGAADQVTEQDSHVTQHEDHVTQQSIKEEAMDVAESDKLPQAIENIPGSDVECKSEDQSETAVSSTDPSTGEGVVMAGESVSTTNEQVTMANDPVVTENDQVAIDESSRQTASEENSVPADNAGAEIHATDSGVEELNVPSEATATITLELELEQNELETSPAEIQSVHEPPTVVADNTHFHTASVVVNSISTGTPQPLFPLTPQPPTTLTPQPLLTTLSPQPLLTTLSPQVLSAPIPLFPKTVTSDYYSDSAPDIQPNQLQQQSQGVSNDNEQGPSRNAPVAQQTAESTTKEKRKKKKRRRRRRHDDQQKQTTPSQENSAPERSVEVEYVQEDLLKPEDPNYRHFHRIMESFKLGDPSKDKKPPREGLGPLEAARLAVADATRRVKEMRAEQLKQDGKELSDSDEDEDEMEQEAEDREKEGEDEQGADADKLSKKKLRKLNRLTVAQLKQLVERPDVVEMHDVTAHDPKLLVLLKSTRNAVPVPRHWCFKRKYLQGKRGIEKPPFNLPDFIKSTGVMEMRQAHDEKEDAKSLKQKTRERVRPKMGKLTIDYQKLHDAFFKWQTKPSMSIHGDLYYEGKEFETRLRQKKPGDLSDELRRALGMPTGAGKHRFPPPWLVAQQRYGPPPSYPNLKIAGLSAPIPDGCSFGYFVGGWGKPPVDERGRPLYGDVFGLDQPETHGLLIPDEDAIDKSFWGEMESEEEEEEEEEESEEETEEMPKPEDIQAGLVTPLEGLVTPSGLTSIPAGLETPEMIQLRKKNIEEAMEQGGETPTLYTVVPEKPSAVGAAMMGSSHVYDMTSAVPGAVKKAAGSASEGVAVALDISELDMDSATMSARYEEQLKEQQGHLQKEDLSDMVAEHAAKQKKRKRAAADSGGKATKKLKEFKF